MIPIYVRNKETTTKETLDTMVTRLAHADHVKLATDWPMMKTARLGSKELGSAAQHLGHLVQVWMIKCVLQQRIVGHLLNNNMQRQTQPTTEEVSETLLNDAKMLCSIENTIDHIALLCICPASLNVTYLHVVQH